MFKLGNSVIKIVLSPPKTEIRKLPKGNFQITRMEGVQAFHKNIEASFLETWFKENFKPPFKQAQVFTEEADFHLLLNKKGEMKILKKKATLTDHPLEHNRKKNYALEDTVLAKLGISSDKRKQIEKFIELCRDTLENLPDFFHIVDFGCGKAYLTFALYAYLEKKGYRFEMAGIDLKAKVMEDSRARAKELGFSHLHFFEEDILAYKGPVDLSLSLHACDIATDIALAKSIVSKAKVILAAPCCQHEFAKQIESSELNPLLKHGLLKERFSSLLTDTFRGLCLESYGYHVQMIEFIDSTHTPKNLLIRAVYKPHPQKMKEARQKMDEMVKMYNLKPYLLSLL